MRERTYWLPRTMLTEHFETRTIYVAHWHAPFVGYMAAADTAFTIPAYVRIRGKRYTGYVAPIDGMAFMQDHDIVAFHYHTRSNAMKGDTQ